MTMNSLGDLDSLDASVDSSGGGSPAAQAYREQLKAEGATEGAAGALPNSAGELPGAATDAASAGRDARAAERKKVSGRARVTLNGHVVGMGKMVDISISGACVMLDDMLPTKKICTLDIDIFHDGKRFLINVPAMSVYGVLAGSKGFKIGFQFGPRSPAASKSLEELLK